jgi:dihydroorotate dehydrogenase electron transfer subunit
MKKIQDCCVKQIKHLNEDTCIIELSMNEIPEKIEAGNFAEIRIDNTSEIFLRRPFSVFNVNYEAQTISFFIKNIGKGTNLLSKLEEGETLNIIYPLGNSFSEIKNGKTLIIGGGSGIAPLILLGESLKKRGSEIIYLLGARSKNDIHLVDEFKKHGKVLIITEDGSLGEKGRVTDHSIWKNVSNFQNIYTCGPNPMMKAIGDIAIANNINCEISLENTMACGFGACLCCVTETTEGNKCVCTEGPVFNVKDLKW